MMYRQGGKILFDRIMAIIILVLASWLIILIVLLYAISFQFPVLYKSVRIGMHARPFIMFKFRTLLANNKLPVKERQFWLGNALRFTNLDELPQLWNVLKGDMSLVGPRPLPIAYASLLSDNQEQRHQVKPGITGLAQVNGKNSLPWGNKFEFDLYYVKHLSFLLDVKILLKTVALLLLMKKDVSLDEKPLGSE